MTRPSGLLENLFQEPGRLVDEKRGFVGRVANNLGVVDSATECVHGGLRRRQELVGLVEVPFLERGNAFRFATLGDAGILGANIPPVP